MIVFLTQWKLVSAVPLHVLCLTALDKSHPSLDRQKELTSRSISESMLILEKD